jgi:asparagine synthase (glutamine-hydrolysing)
MCGIAGIISLKGTPVPDLTRKLEVMSDLVAHRGPDDAGIWTHPRGHVGFAHRRLSIIDLAHGHQPMSDEAGNVITYNGETYNYPEVRADLSGERFATDCDTEVVLAAYRRWGADSLDRLRGMYAYAVWDERRGELFIARDRFGIKPLVYAVVDDVLYFASEAKALMPFLPRIATDHEALKDYLAFQFCLAGKTLFEGVRELQPGYKLTVAGGTVREERYWEVYYELDWSHTTRWFESRIEELLHESVRLHLRSDVPVASYLSGGLDSSAVASVASVYSGGDPMKAFVGKFSEDPRFDESRYARIVADQRGLDLHEVDICVDDFLGTIGTIAYHMDFPAAGPGSFPQYMVSQAASRACKVILGGQGGDEVFGGYARYLIAYFEQCIKAAIDGTMHNGSFVVTYESIIPNLAALENYKPLLSHFWGDGLFEDLDARYFRLINRAPDLDGVVDFGELGGYEPFETFRTIFNGSNVGHESYFDKMTHFDFKTLLPALLQVEDRVSMAHGLESRVPLLDHRLVELAATIPADSKFRDGRMKHIFKETTRTLVPDAIAERKDKMGFPVPLTDWMGGPAREFFTDVFSSEAARGRPYVDSDRVMAALGRESRFGRKVWGLLSLELWQRAFHDREHDFKRLLTQERTATTS